MEGHRQVEFTHLLCASRRVVGNSQAQILFFDEHREGILVAMITMSADSKINSLRKREFTVLCYCFQDTK